MNHIKHILLADDDEDDCILFEDVLRDIFDSFKLTKAINGRQLMQILYQNISDLPDVIFLDVNMPGKNGFECLKEIKDNEKLQQLPVIIFSTSAQPYALDILYELGANLYIRKPDSFVKLKTIIQNILTQNNFIQPPKVEFLVEV